MLHLLSLGALLKRLLQQRASDIEKIALVLISFGLVQAASYSVLQVAGSYCWYYVPLLISIWTGSLYAMQLLPRLSHAGLLAILILSFVTSQHIGPAVWAGPLGDMYLEIGNYLNQNYSDGKQVALGETGIMGYTVRERPVLDYWGIVSPFVMEAYYKEHLSFPEMIARSRPPYLVYDGPTPERYGALHSFQNGIYKLTLFKRIAD